MMKKFLALMLAIFLAANSCNVAAAKTPQEKQAEKEAKQEFKLEQKQNKQLAAMYRRTNILKVQQWANEGDLQAKIILSYAKLTDQRVDRDVNAAIDIKATVASENGDLAKHFIPIEYINERKVYLPQLYGFAASRSMTGQYVPRSYDDAIRWAELGASEYDPLSFAVLGSLYYTGRGFRQDYKKAIEYAKLSMKYSPKKKAEPLALFILADAYKHGHGVDLDLKKSQFYKDYLDLVRQPKIDQRTAKNEVIFEKRTQAEEKRQAKIEEKAAEAKKAERQKIEAEIQNKHSKDAATSETPKDTATSETPKDVATSETPKDTAISETPKDTATSETPKNTATSETPKDTATSETPKDAATSETPKDTATSETPKDVATSETPKNAATSETPKDTAISETPKDTATSETPKDTATSETPKDTAISKTPKDTATSETPKDTAISKTPKDTATSETPKDTAISEKHDDVEIFEPPDDTETTKNQPKFDDENAIFVNEPFQNKKIQEQVK